MNTSANADLNAAVTRWFVRLFLIKVAQHVFTWWIVKKLRSANGG